MSLTFYRLHDDAVPVTPGGPQRGWMDNSPDRSAYSYPTIPMANAAGWELLCPVGFTVFWTGEADSASIEIVYDNPDARPFVEAGPGGILSFHAGYLLKTSPGVSLWLKGSPNRPRAGSHAVEGLLQAAWDPFPLVVQWRLYQPGQHRFDEGAPFGFVTPMRLADLECEVTTEDPASDADAQAAFSAWSAAPSNCHGRAAPSDRQFPVESVAPVSAVAPAVEFDLTCYRLANAVEVVPARPSRAIFDRNKHAYRCLPLSTANAAGWELLCPTGFTATWDGGTGADALKIEYDDAAAHPFASSHFAHGILTFDTGWLFRTSDGFGMWVMGSPNDPKEGIYPLAGLVETSWLNYTFTMNWQFTRPGSIRFEKGEPFAFLTPGPIQAIEACQPRQLLVGQDPVVSADLAAWTKERDDLVARMIERDPAALKQGWGRRYFKGEAPPGASPAPPGHVHKMRTKAPALDASSPPECAGENDGLSVSAATRVITSQAEALAAGIDFLVLDQLVDDATCETLCEAFQAHSDLCSDREPDPFWQDRILRASALAGVAPEAAALMRRALQAGTALVAAFYEVEAPLYPDTLNLVGWREGMSMPVHADDGYREGDERPLAHRAYSGVLYINDGYEGGGLYLPGQDILIVPKRGMFVSLPAGESHSHAVVRVESGIRLTMPFFLTLDRAKATSHLL